MLSSTKVTVMAEAASHDVLLVVTVVVDIVILYFASMNRREISNQCVCCERMT